MRLPSAPWWCMTALVQEIAVGVLNFMSDISETGGVVESGRFLPIQLRKLAMYVNVEKPKGKNIDGDQFLQHTCRSSHRTEPNSQTGSVCRRAGAQGGEHLSRIISSTYLSKYLSSLLALYRDRRGYDKKEQGRIRNRLHHCRVLYSLRTSYCKTNGSGIFASSPRGFSIRKWQSLGAVCGLTSWALVSLLLVQT